MLKKIFKSNTGSTLVLVLFFLSILSMLGITILSVSTVNLKMKVVDKNAKNSLYLAESGLQEAYAEIGKVIEKGIDVGNEKVDEKLNEFIEEEKKKEEESREKAALDPENKIEIYESPYLTDEGFIDQERLEKDKKNTMINWFREGYTTSVNEKLEGTILNGKNYNIVDKDIDSSNAQVSIIEPISLYQIINQESEDSEKEPDAEESKDKIENEIVDEKIKEYRNYQITLLSEFTHKEIEKDVRATFILKVPDYRAAYFSDYTVVQLDENILWKKSLTTEKNIFVEDDNVTIKGDIYAYGTAENGSTKGGIIVGNEGKGVNLSVYNGQVATNEYLLTNDSNSSITLNNGDLYCKILEIPEKTKNCAVTIDKGTVNTLDDIELNGENAKIVINGSYFGFTEGSNSSHHEESSSIVINSPDLGSGTSLKITGEEIPGYDTETSQLVGNDYYSEKYNDKNNKIFGYGIIIGGTGYISELKDELDQKYDYQTGESVCIKGNYVAYTQYLKDLTRKGKFHPDNIIINYFPPLFLANKYFLSGGTEELYTVVDKSEYFQHYKNDYYGLNLNLGSENGLQLENVRHSTGVYISKNNIFSSKYNNDIASIFTEKNEDYQYYVNKMSDPQVVTLSNEGRVFNGLGTRTMITDQFAFTNNIIINEANELIRINNSPDISITINEDIKKGIIITKGDVYIKGKVNFRGTIVAEGNIYFQDKGAKKITHDENYLRQTISKNETLRDQFKNNGKTQSFVTDSKLGVDETGSYLKFSKLIDIAWKR
ncbi:hypothetical protein SAMN00017405_0310 [Desulfonispora thiosulfatigenes DSM 11270]|uniref:PilX N-terminal n=1 Tax=Desulfonispora thiosulfatigenes DSM 11270 TaxID=656914 RepID=A0A1W1VQ25_DESTI|nr:DUF2572 family protein [Desulfonispora thiosulfatigenes]SMB95014.1 hypothetical protein SAMN00017405_0310 [Desulfonispora thiosulfatigenes DSM 11270]